MALERPSAPGSAGAQWWWCRGRSTGEWRGDYAPLDPLSQVVHRALGMAFADELVRVFAGGEVGNEVIVFLPVQVTWSTWSKGFPKSVTDGNRLTPSWSRSKLVHLDHSIGPGPGPFGLADLDAPGPLI